MSNPFERIVLSPRVLAVCALSSWAALSGCGETNETTPATATEAAPGEGGSASTAKAPAESSEGTESADPSAQDSAQGGYASNGGNLFKGPQPWTKDVSNLPKNGHSDDIIQWLGDHGGWGTPRLRIEFSIKLLEADSSTPFQRFEPTEDFYEPDCDNIPFPVPSGGALEDEDGYECTTDGDCHLLVIHKPTNKLYEMWRANMSGGHFYGGCATVWDLNKSYNRGRGQGCTSADAGGFPVSAMVFTADEVAKGSIDHAIRFILPNARIRKGVYVWPATHASNALKGGDNAPPYGVRLRLRQDFPLESLPSDGARVIARALQRYGMILSDGGRVPLTAANDQFTAHKWEDVGVGPDSVGGIQVSDMEVVDMGEPIKNDDCERN
ncbi:MAG: hypothetical protein QM820_10850 [Minicystis sp.]